MSLDTWLAFVAASAVLLAIPGPTVLLVISYALGHGRAAALRMVGGVVLGDFTSMTLSLMGLGALLSTSATVFTVVKWAGALYLLFLGVKLWRAPVGEAGDEAPLPGRVFWHAYAVTALNPKTILFFVAFLPLFLHGDRPLVPQMAILEATFLGLAVMNTALYAVLASAARDQIRRSAVRRWINRTGGTLLIGCGLLAASWKRAS